MVYWLWHCYKRICQPVPVIWGTIPIGAVIVASHWDLNLLYGWTPLWSALLLDSSNNYICSCVQELTTLSASHHCVWMDPRKEFVPPRFHRRCNYSEHQRERQVYIYLLKLPFFYPHAVYCFLLLSLFLMQAKKRKTGKYFLWLSVWTWNQRGDLSAFPVKCLFVWLCVGGICSAAFLNHNHYSVVPCPAIAHRYSQRKPAL